MGLTMQPPVRVSVRKSRYVIDEGSRVRGRIVGLAFDEDRFLWAYAIIDDDAPILSPFGVEEYGPWPMDTDIFVGVAQPWNLGAFGSNGFQVVPHPPIFVYAEVIDDET